jgi:hypothetical protein
MKTIYIKKAEGRNRTRLYIASSIILFLVTLRALSPIMIENVINHAGSGDNGYAFRVDDIGLKLLKGEVSVGEVKIFSKTTDVNFVEARDLVFDFEPSKLFSDKKTFIMEGKQIDITLSKDLFEEVKRLKTAGKKAPKKEIYLERIEADFDRINIKQKQGKEARTLITLENMEAELKDFGVGSINENTKFDVNSNIAGGGYIHLEGKTSQVQQETPWKIEGKMEEISSKVIEKLAGNKLPFEVEKANIHANISAQSKGGEVTGILQPIIKDFKVAEDKEQSGVKRAVAKVANYVFEKTKGKDDEINLKLPFTLNENFTLNLPDTMDKIIK